MINAEPRYSVHCFAGESEDQSGRLGGQGQRERTTRSSVVIRKQSEKLSTRLASTALPFGRPCSRPSGSAVHVFAKSYPVDREFLTAPVIHAPGQLNSLESMCAQHTGRGARHVRGLADRNDRLRAVQTQLRQLPPEGLDRHIHRASDMAMSEFTPGSDIEQLNLRAVRDPVVQLSRRYLRDLPERRPLRNHDHHLLPPCVLQDDCYVTNTSAAHRGSGSWSSCPSPA